MDTRKKEEFAELSKALGHPNRLEIIKILVKLPSDSQCMVGNIVDKLPISQSTVSQHLKILKEAGWIEGKIDGPSVCYCLREGVFHQFTKLLQELQGNYSDINLCKRKN